MALVKCKECGKEVSSGAQKCPYCGVKNPGISNRTYLIVFAIFAVLISYFLIKGCNDDKSAVKASESTEASQDGANSNFASQDIISQRISDYEEYDKKDTIPYTNVQRDIEEIGTTWRIVWKLVLSQKPTKQELEKQVDYLHKEILYIPIFRVRKNNDISVYIYHDKALQKKDGMTWDAMIKQGENDSTAVITYSQEYSQ